jgi:uncharacterized membrane protein YesL
MFFLKVPFKGTFKKSFRKQNLLDSSYMVGLVSLAKARLTLKLSTYGAKALLVVSLFYLFLLLALSIFVYCCCGSATTTGQKE